MKQIVAALALIALTACGSAAPEHAPSPTPSAAPELPLPDAISASRHGIWGTDQNDWRIDKSGSVRIRRDYQDGGRTVRFTIPPAEFVVIRDVLGSLEQRRGKFLGNGDCSTDQEGALIIWRYWKRTVDLGIDGGCSGSVYDAAFATLDAISQKLETLGKAAPDRKVTNGTR